MGKVPPEVFYGRRDAIRELQRRDGSCLVYGGRQMGKSALLRYVQRRSHNPERNQYAWVEEIDNLGGMSILSKNREIFGPDYGGYFF